MSIRKEDKLIVDMFYSDNHVEVNLDAFLTSEEYAKESIKNLKLNQGAVFDQNADRSMHKRVTHSVALQSEQGFLPAIFILQRFLMVMDHIP